MTLKMLKVRPLFTKKHAIESTKKESYLNLSKS